MTLQLKSSPRGGLGRRAPRRTSVPALQGEELFDMKKIELGIC